MHDEKTISVEELSQQIARLSSLQYLRFVSEALKLERGRQAQNLEYGYSDVGSRILLAMYNSKKIHMGYVDEIASNFFISYHVPAFMHNFSFIELLRKDIQQILDYDDRLLTSEIDGKQVSGTAMYWARNFHESFYYVTNKDFGPEFNRDEGRFLTELGQIEEEFGARILPIGPTGFANKIEEYPLVDTLIDAMSPLDGFAISITPSRISVFPFVPFDLFVKSSPLKQTFTFNMPFSPMAASVSEALFGLQDLINLSPKESEIESFLLTNKDLLFTDKYIDVKPQVVIGPRGERPDFFLETQQGTWEALEIKLPKAVFKVSPNDFGCVELSRYLYSALEQCLKYLTIMEKVSTKNKLYRTHGITYEEPRITLLIGKESFSDQLVEKVLRVSDSRVYVESYEELMAKAIKTKTDILRTYSSFERGSKR